MRLNNIFRTLQGEGWAVGTPMVFIRLQGCNLRCAWCDTLQAQDSRGGYSAEIDEVLAKVRVSQPYGRSWVCITGGEPLFQEKELWELLKTLKLEGYKTLIETNGSYPRPFWASTRDPISDRLVDCWSVDIKPPSSGIAIEEDILKGWFRGFRRDQLKFPAMDIDDLGFIARVLRNNAIMPMVYIQPIVQEGEDLLSRKIWWQRVWNFCLECNVNMSLQRHKVVWGEDTLK